MLISVWFLLVAEALRELSGLFCIDCLGFRFVRFFGLLVLFFGSPGESVVGRWGDLWGFDCFPVIFVLFYVLGLLCS